MLKANNVKGQNILVYRHDTSADQRAIHENEIRAITDYFQNAHVTFVEVTSRVTLRILDVKYPALKGNQARGEFLITQKLTRTVSKRIEYFIRHVDRSNPIR